MYSCHIVSSIINAFDKSVNFHFKAHNAHMSKQNIDTDQLASYSLLF